MDSDIMHRGRNLSYGPNPECWGILDIVMFRMMDNVIVE
jgi:hypothetical protein